MPAELRVDLRLALRALGAARLRDVAALREQSFDDGVALPVRQGLMPAPMLPRALAAAPGSPWGAAPPAGQTAGTADSSAASPATGDAGDGGGAGSGAAASADEGEGEGREVARSRRISGRRLRQGVRATAPPRAPRPHPRRRW